MITAFDSASEVTTVWRYTNLFIIIIIFFAATNVSWGKIMNSYLPRTRLVQAMRLAHAVYGGHLGSRKTKARLKLSFTWPTIAIDVQTGLCDKQ